MIAKRNRNVNAFFRNFSIFLDVCIVVTKSLYLRGEKYAEARVDIRPIGFFDSGVGGASVLAEALAVLPHENYIYYGDDANAPYGDRGDEEIARLTLAGMDALARLGAKAIVLACNTATATCVGEVRAHLAVPVVSVEPAVKPACKAPGEGKILVLTTAATARLPRFRALCARMPDPARIESVACPGLVERIEHGLFEPSDFDDLFDRHFSFLHGMKIDGIVLGCTHYVFIKKAISVYAKAHFAGACHLYDGNAATVRQLARVLEAQDILNGAGGSRVDYVTSGDQKRLEPLFRSLISQ